MNSREKRNLKRFSERMFKTLDLSGIAGASIKWELDQEQPGIGERILTGQLEITRDLIEFGVVKD
jgi:hypothetical protein